RQRDLVQDLPQPGRDLERQFLAGLPRRADAPGPRDPARRGASRRPAKSARYWTTVTLTLPTMLTSSLICHSKSVGADGVDCPERAWVPTIFAGAAPAFTAAR